MNPAQKGVDCTLNFAVLAVTNEIMAIIRPKTASMMPSTKATLACFSCKEFDMLFQLFQDEDLRCCFFNTAKGLE